MNTIYTDKVDKKSSKQGCSKRFMRELPESKNTLKTLLKEKKTELSNDLQSLKIQEKILFLNNF